MTDSSPSRAERRTEISQHIGWLKMYAAEMSSSNWRDMKDRIERQVRELREAVDAELKAADMTEAQMTDQADSRAERCAEIEARANAATEGPWQLIRQGDDATRTRYSWSIWHEDGNKFVLDMEREHQVPSVEWVQQRDLDFAFVIHARSDIPYLLYKLKAAREEIELVRAFTKRLSEAMRKIRPLGGSELFVKLGNDYFADPEFCGAAIEELRNGKHAACVEIQRLKSLLAEGRAALLELKRLGEQGMRPDYGQWITFHDEVAWIAAEAVKKMENVNVD